MLIKFVFGIFIFICAAQIISAQNQDYYFAHLQAEHRKVLQNWLTKNTDMRPAVENDASKQDLEAWRHDDKKFFPFYVVRDFNQDGTEDFAVMLKIEKPADEGAIVIFNAPFKNPKPAYLKRGFGVQTYYLKFMQDVKMLYFTQYETHGFYLKPKGKNMLSTTLIKREFSKIES